jgi:hypothetical protein
MICLLDKQVGKHLNSETTRCAYYLNKGSTDAKEIDDTKILNNVGKCNGCKEVS